MTKADEISALDTLLKDIHCSEINLLISRKLLEEMVKGNCLLSIPQVKQGAMLLKKNKKMLFPKKCNDWFYWGKMLNSFEGETGTR